MQLLRKAWGWIKSVMQCKTVLCPWEVSNTIGVMLHSLQNAFTRMGSFNFHNGILLGISSFYAPHFSVEVLAQRLPSE